MVTKKRSMSRINRVSFWCTVQPFCHQHQQLLHKRIISSMIFQSCQRELDTLFQNYELINKRVLLSQTVGFRIIIYDEQNIFSSNGDVQKQENYVNKKRKKESESEGLKGSESKSLEQKRESKGGKNDGIAGSPRPSSCLY